MSPTEGSPFGSAGELVEHVLWRSEGGYVATAERDSQYLLIVDESILAELIGSALDPDLRQHLRKVSSFTSSEARDRRIEELRGE